MLLHSFLVVSAIAGTVFAGGSSSPTPVAQVKIGHDKYNYLGLVGHADFPSDARDQYGDTAGGWGSGIAADLSKWKKNKDGSYSGIIYGVPDRGWNTNGISAVYASNYLKARSIIRLESTGSESPLRRIMVPRQCR